MLSRLTYSYAMIIWEDSFEMVETGFFRAIFAF